MSITRFLEQSGESFVWYPETDAELMLFTMCESYQIDPDQCSITISLALDLAADVSEAARMIVAGFSHVELVKNGYIIIHPAR